MSTAVHRAGNKVSYVCSTVNSSSTLGKMADVSKDRLRKEITAILKNADLKQMSAKKVRQQLEEKLEVDLTDQKKTVDELVMEFLKEKKSGGKKGKKKESDEEDEENDEEEENSAGEDEEEEEEKEKRKGTKRSASKNNRASESEEPSDEDEEEHAKKRAKTSAKKGGGKKKKKGSDNDSDEDWAKNKRKSGRKGGSKGGYTKPCQLSPELAKLVGKDTMPRHEVVKKIWAIIKERNLYDPRNKQFAICDNDLKKVFGVERFRTFGMMKYLKSHFV